MGSRDRRITRRRFLKESAVAVASLGLAVGATRAMDGPAPDDVLRVALIAPLPVGRFLPLDHVAAAARRGALVGVDDVSNHAGLEGRQIELLVANAPNAAAAARAANRLATIGGVRAIVGGVGASQAEALARVAREHDVLFFNVASQEDQLRTETCSPHTFHIEASHAMYLDAIVDFYRERGSRSWSVLHADDARGRRLLERALVAIEGAGGSTDLVAAVGPRQVVFTTETLRLRDAGSDVVLLLLEWDQEGFFMSQADKVGLGIPLATLAGPVAQTRSQLADLRDGAPALALHPRFSLWDTTIDVGVAGSLNARYTSRWGDPMEPTAWAAYQSLRIIGQSVAEVGHDETAALIEYLEDSGTSFASDKGVQLSFRSWDHQLRQPLYAVALDPEAAWGRLMTSRVNLVLSATAVPDGAVSVDALDGIGDGPTPGSCGAGS